MQGQHRSPMPGRSPCKSVSIPAQPSADLRMDSQSRPSEEGTRQSEVLSPVVPAALMAPVGLDELRDRWLSTWDKTGCPYQSNIANIVKNTRTINSAYYQSRKEGPGLPQLIPELTGLAFKPSFGTGKFPRDIFSLGRRARPPLP